MITQRRRKLTDAEARRNYDTATLRDSVNGHAVCQRCRRNDCGAVQRDHRQNRDSFNTVPSNLQCLGAVCHKWKTENPKDAIRDGWAVPKSTRLTPAEWPARRWIQTAYGTLRLGWVLYDDEGDFEEITADRAAELMHEGGFEHAA